MFVLVVSSLIVHAWAQRPADPGIEVNSAVAERSPMEGRVVIIDAGHGLPDGGCVGRTTGIKEESLNLDVAKRLKRILAGAGASIVMTREDEYALHPRDMPVGNRKKTDFEKRAEIIAGAHADLIISVHMNQYPVTTRRGALAFFDPDDVQGKKLASLITEQVKNLPGSEKSVPQTGDFFMLRQGVSGVLLECGFLSNATDEVNLSRPEYREKVALLTANAVAEYFSRLPEVYGPLMPR